MIDGVLLLDKPAGISSNAATQRVRRLLRSPKAGHVGSLDPLATGMLPICLGEATKLAGEVLEGAKVYRFSIHLGSRTSTGDAEGEIVERAAVPALDPARINEVLQGFLGPIQQVPPMYSAIKRGGRPLYKLARAGQTVEREARTVRIDALSCLAIGPEELDCRVECGKGTYVRVLAEDIAAALGTVGHVSSLRRERVEPFPPEAMISLAELERRLDAGETPPLLAPAAAVPHLPAIELEAQDARRILSGQQVSLTSHALPVGQRVRITGPLGVFLGIGQVASPGRLAPKRLVATASSE